MSSDDDIDRKIDDEGRAGARREKRRQQRLVVPLGDGLLDECEAFLLDQMRVGCRRGR